MWVNLVWVVLSTHALYFSHTWIEDYWPKINKVWDVKGAVKIALSFSFWYFSIEYSISDWPLTVYLSALNLAFSSSQVLIFFPSNLMLFQLIFRAKFWLNFVWVFGLRISRVTSFTQNKRSRVLTFSYNTLFFETLLL